MNYGDNEDNGATPTPVLGVLSDIAKVKRQSAPVTGVLGNLSSGNVFGYPLRQPFPSEAQYFQANPNVAGMASEDQKIVLNPFSSHLSDEQRLAVAKNEAARLYMRGRGFDFGFDVLPHQAAFFEKTPYANDPTNMRQTILARALSGDQSVAPYSERQMQLAKYLLGQLTNNKPSP